ncbi:translation initiation factor 2 [Pseudomonas sp. NPDC099000]|uniref:translation initiation factor 2 n=1 Tax=Pseudomonas sp. NPDC099000 TaxID=3364488 RepID=UPI00383AC93C
MKPFFPAACLSICLFLTVNAQGVMAASTQEKPAASETTSKKPAPVKKATAVKKNAAPVKKKQTALKKRPPISSKSKSAREVAKTQLPPADLDLSLPKDMVQELKPVGTVPMPRRDAVLPQMFGDKSSPFQLNGRLLNNEMQLQLRNEERRDVEGAALDFEFKQ